MPPFSDPDGDAGRPGLHPLEWLNFFLADVQTGLGPFIAAYLATRQWNPERVGMVMTPGGMVTVVLQTPAGAMVDRAHRKRAVIAAGIGALVVGACLLLVSAGMPAVCTAEVLIGAAGPFLGPTLAAITLGMVGAAAFPRQFGRNQSFNAAGNVFTALLIGILTHFYGGRAIFQAAAGLAVPAWMILSAIPGRRIDYARARGADAEATHGADGERVQISGVAAVLSDRVLLSFFGCACLFHLANAAMLPQLGELLSLHQSRNAAAFMSACIIVTQLVITCTAPWIARQATRLGRRPLLLFAFAVLPVRGILYTLVRGIAPLVAVQLLDGVANAIFGVVSILIVADRTRGTGRFNLMQGALGTVVGIGAALSTTVGGALIQHFSFRISFLGLAAIATAAFGMLFFTLPETRRVEMKSSDSRAQPA